MTWVVVLTPSGGVETQLDAFVSVSDLILASAPTRPEANLIRDEYVRTKEAEKKADEGQKELFG